MPSTRRSIIETTHTSEEAVVRRSLILAGVAILAFPGLAFAEAAAPSSLAAPLAFIAAGIGLGIAAGLCGMGQGRAAAAAVDAIGRQPAAAGRIQTVMLIGLAFVESLVLYMFVIAIILVVKF